MIRNENVIPPYPDIVRLQACDNHVGGLFWSPNNQQFICYSDETMFRYDLQNGNARLTRNNHDAVSFMTVSKDLSIIVMQSQLTGEYLYWDNRQQPMGLLYRWTPIFHQHRPIEISPNGNIMAVLGRYIITFHIGIKSNINEVVSIHQEHNLELDVCDRMEFSPDLLTGVYAGVDSALNILVCKETYNEATNSLIHHRYIISEHNSRSSISTLKLSNDGSMVVVGWRCGRIDLLNITNTADGFEMNRSNLFNQDENGRPGNYPPRYDVSFSFDDSYIIAGHVMESTIRFYNITDGRIETRKTGLPGTINLLRPSSDGRFLLFRNGDWIYLTTLKGFLHPF